MCAIAHAYTSYSEQNMNRTKGYIYIFTAGCLWGFIGLFVNLLTACGADSGTTAFIRMCSGMLLMIPLLLASGGPALFHIYKKGLGICLILGVFGQAAFNYAYTWAIRLVGVATGSVLLYTAPIFVCIMSWMIFKEELGKKKFLALGINIIGCILTVTGGNFSAMSFSVIGVCAGIMAGFLYAMVTIMGTLGKNYNSLTITFYSFFFGTLTLALIVQPWGNIAECMSLPFVLSSIGYGLVPTVGSYFFYMRGLTADLETSKVPVVASVETVVAALIGILLYHEAAGFGKLAGIALVIVSIAVMNMNFDKKKA